MVQELLDLSWWTWFWFALKCGSAWSVALLIVYSPILVLQYIVSR